MSYVPSFLKGLLWHWIGADLLWRGVSVVQNKHLASEYCMNTCYVLKLVQSVFNCTFIGTKIIQLFGQFGNLTNVKVQVVHFSKWNRIILSCLISEHKQTKLLFFVIILGGEWGSIAWEGKGSDGSKFETHDVVRRSLCLNPTRYQGTLETEIWLIWLLTW